jgi:hypothetical protein
MDKAERLVKEELHRLGWRELDLEGVFADFSTV